MNKVYKLKWRRGDFGIWHTIKVIGHQYETDSNKLICYLPDGGLREVAHWSDCEMMLGADWQSLINDNTGNTEFVKDKIEEQEAQRKENERAKKEIKRKRK